MNNSWLNFNDDREMQDDNDGVIDKNRIREDIEFLKTCHKTYFDTRRDKIVELVGTVDNHVTICDDIVDITDQINGLSDAIKLMNGTTTWDDLGVFHDAIDFLDSELVSFVRIRGNFIDALISSKENVDDIPKSLEIISMIIQGYMSAIATLEHMKNVLKLEASLK